MYSHSSNDSQQQIEFACPAFLKTEENPNTITLKEYTHRTEDNIKVREMLDVLKSQSLKNPAITSPSDVFFRSKIHKEMKEHFVVFYLDSQKQVIEEETISIGSLNAAIVHPREVYRKAVILAAASIICMHNHPSGTTTPSTDDINLTRRLSEAGSLMGIELVDHIIVAKEDYYSMKERGDL